MNRLPKNPLPFSLKGCYLAGGAILSVVTKKDISDYDIYPKTKKDMIDIFYTLEDEGCFVVNVSDRAVTFKSNDITNDKGERAIIQVMTFDEFTSPDQIFDYFDFSVCMGAFDTDTQQYHFHSDFWPSVSSRTLYFNPNTKFPLNSAIRVSKYTAKGYFLPKTESIKMSLAVIQGGMPNSWDELEAAIGGSYGRNVKLFADGKEYSYQTALEVLDSMSHDFDYDDKDYSDINAEMLENAMSSKPIKIIELQRVNSWSMSVNTHRHIVRDDGTFSASITARQAEAYDLLGVKFEETDSDEVFYGYKTLRKKEDGTYENIINSKKICYRLGMESVEKTPPHIFLHPTKPTSKKGDYVTAKFSFWARHIKNISSNEYQVEYVKFEEIVE